ncbi:hypothetical protein F3Y22_tig00117005pilonHSYRG00207 [Hibiscus syriacus]|uniref:CCHC-type domain-containing protein n=1 Tax=Hibiscus syriacus TaxID=106335 RepID=A0A6A2WD60_HIBSY|nr:hypothetical protein F3Y22_tig00117005pilonHSYRG00207 [Hibiscus syriacus]
MGYIVDELTSLELDTGEDDVWHPMEGIAILDLGENMFLFRLFLEMDVKRIENGGQWNFNSHLLILQSFEEYDTTGIALGYKRIMWIRVRLDVRLALKRKKKLQLKNGSFHYVRFEYEKLTLFCFVCGKLGHGESFCPIRARHGGDELPMAWDLSIRTPSGRSAPPKSVWLRKDGDYEASGS